MLRLPLAAETALVAGARDPQPVRGLTHGFYKYPARFSPSFARAAIEIFTQPGDLVLDNHVGGGTTLVEALALGRRDAVSARAAVRVATHGGRRPRRKEIKGLRDKGAIFETVLLDAGQRGSRDLGGQKSGHSGPPARPLISSRHDQ